MKEEELEEGKSSAPFLLLDSERLGDAPAESTAKRSEEELASAANKSALVEVVWLVVDFARVPGCQLL